jgi:tRNA pseudouridine55 synthase
LRKLLLGADTALAGLPEVDLEAALAARFCGGQEVAAPMVGEGLARVYDEQHEFLGIGELFRNGKIAPRRVFRVAAR